MKGLLERENLERARVYLEEMDTASARLSFSFHTGSPILDILLENKMALARNKGISVTSAIGPFLPVPLTTWISAAFCQMHWTMPSMPAKN